MEIAGTQQAAPQEGISTTTIFAGVVFIIALAGVGFYLIERNKSVVPALPTNKDNPIPGIPQTGGGNAGAQAVGILTDQNFFKGLTDMASVIAGIVEKSKKNKESQTNYTANDYKPTAPAQTGGGTTVLTGTQASGNWGGW